MTAYVALLRGISPSGRNMTNDKLRGVFEELGFTGVGSVLASGNLTFHSPDADVAALEGRVEAALVSRLEVSSRTIIRSAAELRALVDSRPFRGLTHGSETYLTATFLKERVGPSGQPSEPPPEAPGVRYDPDARAVLAVTDNRDPGNGSRYVAWLERTYGKDITTRSWLTVQRVLAKLEAPSVGHD